MPVRASRLGESASRRADVVLLGRKARALVTGVARCEDDRHTTVTPLRRSARHTVASRAPRRARWGTAASPCVLCSVFCRGERRAPWGSAARPWFLCSVVWFSLSLSRARLPVPLGAAPRVLRAHHSEWAAGATHCAIDRLSSLVPGARRGVSRWRGASRSGLFTTKRERSWSRSASAVSYDGDDGIDQPCAIPRRCASRAEQPPATTNRHIRTKQTHETKPHVTWCCDRS